MEDILIPLGLFTMIAVISVASITAGIQSRRELNETLRRAIDSGQQLDPRTIAAMMKPVKPASADLRSGLIIGALGLGFAVVSVLAQLEVLPGGTGASSGFVIVGVILLALGIGYLASAFLRRDETRG